MARIRPHFLLLFVALLALAAPAAARGADLGASPSASPSGSPTPLPTPTMTATISPRAVIYGSATTLSGTISVPGAELVLERKRAGETVWVPRSTTLSASNGSFVFHPLPVCTTTYRVSYAGSADWAPVAREVTVQVRCALVFKAPAPFYQGRSVTLTGRLSPNHAGTVIKVQRKVAGVWQDWKSPTLNTDSRFAVVFDPSAYGKFLFRVAMTGDPDHKDFVSSAREVVALNSNPHNVPAGQAHYIVIDKSEYKLYYYERGHIVRVFKVCLGRPGFPTPEGYFHIHSKVLYPGGALGAAIMYYYPGGIGIHGNNEPWLFSRFPRNFSHGCTRMLNNEVLWLYARCPVGTNIHNIR